MEGRGYGGLQKKHNLASESRDPITLLLFNLSSQNITKAKTWCRGDHHEVGDGEMEVDVDLQALSRLKAPTAEERRAASFSTSSLKILALMCPLFGGSLAFRFLQVVRSVPSRSPIASVVKKKKQQQLPQRIQRATLLHLEEIVNPRSLGNLLQLTWLDRIFVALRKTRCPTNNALSRLAFGQAKCLTFS